MEVFPLASFYKFGQRELNSYLLCKQDVPKSEAIIKLENFVANGQHKECLLSLYRNQEYSNLNIQVILATHLFGPLTGENSYKIGNNGFPTDANVRCPNCNLDVNATVQNTSLGNGDVWHGYADIFVNRSIVKIAVKEDEEDSSVEPLHKRMRTGSTEDDDGSSSDESHDSDSIGEVKMDIIGSRAISQGLAQTIVNCFCEVKRNPSLLRCFIPSFIATRHTVRICMYNCGIDRLIMTKDKDLFLAKGILNCKTILSLWYVLNFGTSFDKMDSDSPSFFELLQQYKKSNFEEQASQKYSIYKDCCTKPMTSKETEKHMNYEISPKFLVSSEIPDLQEMIKCNLEFISSFKHNS